MNYINRVIEKTIREYLSIFPALALTGPRQSGKTTTLQKMFSSQYEYVSLDDPLMVDFFNRDPKGFIERYNNKVIFDEIQKAPKLFDYLKIEIDRDRQNYGKFILIGSSQFSFIKQITESLAGRIGALTLLPLQFQEVPQKLKKYHLLKGGYPEQVSRNFDNTDEWYSAYVSHYIERDVRALHNIGNLRDFQRLVMLLAARVSQELNMSSLASDLGVTVKTIQSWISILEASYIIFLLPPYYKNFGKRIVKRPKIYFFDTGLACFLTAIRDEEVLLRGPLDGPMFENYVIAEIKKIIAHNKWDISLHYFRNNLGIESDLIIEDRVRRKIHFVEIKSGSTAKVIMLKNLETLLSLNEESRDREAFKSSGDLVYRGKTSDIFRDKNCQCTNYFDFITDFSLFTDKEVTK